MARIRELYQPNQSNWSSPLRKLKAKNSDILRKEHTRFSSELIRNMFWNDTHTYYLICHSISVWWSTRSTPSSRTSSTPSAAVSACLRPEGIWISPSLRLLLCLLSPGLSACFGLLGRGTCLPRCRFCWSWGISAIPQGEGQFMGRLLSPSSPFWP